MTGRFDEALREILRARELDPLSPSVVQALAWCYYQQRKFNESVVTYENMLEGVPEFALGLAGFAWTLRALGRAEEAVKVSEKALQFSGGGQFFITGLGASYALAGRIDNARAALKELKEMSARAYVSPYHTATVHVHLGEHDRAIALLKEAYEINDGWLVWLGVDPVLDALRDEPGFEELLSKTRNPAPQEIVRYKPARREKASIGHSSVTSAIATPAPDTSPGEDDEARQLFTAGRYYATRRSAEGLRQAIQRLERAVELKPDYAEAYSELADCYALLNWYVEPPPSEAWEKAKHAALNAVKANDLLAEAHASLGFVRLHYDRD